MKKFVSLVGIGLVAAMVLAFPLTAFAAGKHHEMTGSVVSVDAKAKTITFKDEKGESHNAALLEKAVGEAASVKPGDKVVLTCSDSEKGEHLGVIAIKKAK